jgi:hypothetical protein
MQPFTSRLAFFLSLFIRKMSSDESSDDTPADRKAGRNKAFDGI